MSSHCVWLDRQAITSHLCLLICKALRYMAHVNESSPSFAPSVGPGSVSKWLSVFK